MAAILRKERYIKTDIAANNNKYWQISEFDDCKCLVEWGRVGDSPQAQTKTFDEQAEASKFFDKKCREKEGDRKGYVKQRTIEVDSKVIVPANTNIRAAAVEQIAKKDSAVAELVEYLVKVNVHAILGSTTMTYDKSTGVFSTPLGIVTQEAIDEARTLLSGMSALVTKRRFSDVSFTSLLNLYLMLIPQDFGRGKISPKDFIGDAEKIKKQNDLLDALQGSLDMVGKPKTSGSDEKVFDVTLELIQSGSEIDNLRKLFHSTLQKAHASSNLDVRRAFNLDIATMTAKFEDKLGNVMRLWHGTQAGNLLSILKNGFVIPPASAAHCSGRMFGNGVYFSDQSSKSLNYSSGYWSGKTDNCCYMLLNDVAMGKAYTPTGASGSLPQKGYDSTFAKANQSGVRNNEMIVYRLSQIKPVRLLEFTPGGK